MKHVMLNLVNLYDDLMLWKNSSVRAGLVEAVKETGATILRVTDHEFEPVGYSCLVLLAESHASIHTFPEDNTLYADFFTCSEDHDVFAFITYMIDYFKPKEIWYEIIER